MIIYINIIFIGSALLALFYVFLIISISCVILLYLSSYILEILLHYFYFKLLVPELAI